MAAAGGKERERRLLGALEAALAEEEEGDRERDSEVPARVLVEHLMDTRRKQKLLLTQLRVLRSLLGVIENPGPPPKSPPDLRGAGVQARCRWRELKLGYRGAVGSLGGALTPTLSLTQRGWGGVRTLRRQQQQQLEAKLRWARIRREELRMELEERRSPRGGAERGGAGCRLQQLLMGGGRGGAPPQRNRTGTPPPSTH